MRLIAAIAALAAVAACTSKTAASSDTPLFASADLGGNADLVRTEPACKKESYPFASEVSCVAIDKATLDKTFFSGDLKAGTAIRLFSPASGRLDLLATRQLAGVPTSSPAGSALQWVGSVYSDSARGVKIGTAMFSIRGSAISGRITAGKDIYEVRPLKGGLHVIIKIDSGKQLPMHPPGAVGRIGPGIPPLPPGPGPNNTASADGGSGGRPATGQGSAAGDCLPIPPNGLAVVDGPTVTVGVVFEDDALPAATDLDAAGKSYGDYANLTMRGSLVSVNVATVGVHAIAPFVRDTPTLTDLAEADTSRPGIAQVLAWRNADRADIVVIVSRSVGWCGFTRMVSPDDAKFGFALVHPDCANAYLQAVHEIGHILGGDHEPAASHSSRSLPTARGHVMADQTRKTVMVESNAIPEPYFSNPKACWSDSKGEATGVAGVADNAGAISLHAPVVAGFFR